MSSTCSGNVISCKRLRVGLPVRSEVIITPPLSAFPPHKDMTVMCMCHCMQYSLGTHLPYVAVTGRKRTLFHCKWANLIGYISRMLY